MTEDVPVNLFDSRPNCCPYDHRLGPGRVVHGWLACICE
jgi:hypothetical protein